MRVYSVYILKKKKKKVLLTWKERMTSTALYKHLVSNFLPTISDGIFESIRAAYEIGRKLMKRTVKADCHCE